MRARPVRLNAAVAWLFIVGSFCFVLGSVPAYVQAVGGSVDAITYFVGSIFFTTASFGQLVQAQSPAMTGVDERTQDERAPIRLRGWLVHDRGWLAAATQFPGTLFFNLSTGAALVHNLSVEQEDQHVWRPDFFGSILFLVASVYAILALGRFLRLDLRSVAWWIAWVNLLGSVLFMASALAGYVLPGSGELIDVRASILGTLLGAVCFLVGAALMFPAWRRAVASADKAPDRTR
jgi:hypothetical protein